MNRVRGTQTQSRLHLFPVYAQPHQADRPENSRNTVTLLAADTRRVVERMEHCSFSHASSSAVAPSSDSLACAAALRDTRAYE